MRKIRLFVLTFVLVFCGAILFTACAKDDNPDIVAVDPTVNVFVSNGSTFTIYNTLSDARIQTSSGDTEGTVAWETPTAYIQLGENTYTWVFTPTDTVRYKTVTGTLKITGQQVFELGLTLSGWTYNQTPNLPSVTGYDGNSSDLSIVYDYYDDDGNLMSSAPSTFGAGSYRVRATVTVLNEYEVVVWKEFEILPVLVNDFDLSINDWTYGTNPKTPQVNSDLADMVKFYYSNTENGTYSQTVPTNAGTYYVKAEISGNNNYYGVSEPVQFKINKAYRVGVAVEVNSINYGETFVRAKINANNLGEVQYLYAKRGSNEWISDFPAVPQAGDYFVKVIIPEAANYYETEFTVGFKVNPIALTGTISGLETKTYTGSSLKPSINIEGLLESDYTLSFEFKKIGADDSEYVALDTESNNFVNAGVYRITAKGVKNYTGSISGTFTVEKSNNKTHEDISNVEYQENLTVKELDLSAGWSWDVEDENYNTALVVGENTRVAIYSDDNYYVEFEVKIFVVDNSTENVWIEEELRLAVANQKVDTINVCGDIELTENLSVNNPKTIVIEENVKLVIPSSRTITIVDEVEIVGNLVKEGEGKLILRTTNITNLMTNVDRIVLKDNIEADDNLELEFSTAEDITCEIDLNYKELEKTSFVVKNIGDNNLNLTIKNGTINSLKNGIEINANNKCNIILENLIVNAENYSLYAYGESGAKINTNMCTFNGTKIGAVLLADHEYTFSSSSFSGGNGIYVNAGTIALEDGSVTSSGEIVETPTEELTTTGHALFIDSSNGGAAISLTINSTTFASGDNTVLIRECAVGSGSAAEVVIETYSTGMTYDSVYCDSATGFIDDDEL